MVNCALPTGFWRVPGELLLSSDHRRRANLSTHRRLHRYYPQKGKRCKQSLILLQQTSFQPLRLTLILNLQKQSKDRFGLDGDEESTMLEESVSPKK